MWIPELEFKPSLLFVALLVALHLCVVAALCMLPPLFLLLLPLLMVSLCVSVAKYGLILLDRSIVQVWLGPTGWSIRYKSQREEGPLQLSGRSHLDSYFIRLSLVAESGRRRHVLVTPGMVGMDTFRKLQVFLRWAPDKNQAAVTR